MLIGFKDDFALWQADFNPVGAVTHLLFAESLALVVGSRRKGHIQVAWAYIVFGPHTRK